MNVHDICTYNVYTCIRCVYKNMYHDHIDVSQTDDFNCEWRHFTTTFPYPVVKWLPLSQSVAIIMPVMLAKHSDSVLLEQLRWLWQPISEFWSSSSDRNALDIYVVMCCVHWYIPLRCIHIQICTIYDQPAQFACDVNESKPHPYIWHLKSFLQLLSDTLVDARHPCSLWLARNPFYSYLVGSDATKEMVASLGDEVRVLQAELHRAHRIIEWYSWILERSDKARGIRVWGNLCLLTVIAALTCVLILAWCRKPLKVSLPVLLGVFGRHRSDSGPETVGRAPG